MTSAFAGGFVRMCGRIETQIKTAPGVLVTPRGHADWLGVDVINRTHSRAARLHIGHGGPWRHGACPVTDCRRRMIVGTGVCGEHASALLAEVSADLKAAGARVTPVGVIVSDGYVSMKTALGQRFGRPVHRVVMEAVLGRALAPGENVHHINGARSDNHPENLELWVTSQPSGQRPEDLATYARALLRRYGTPAEREAYQRAKAH